MMRVASVLPTISNVEIACHNEDIINVNFSILEIL